MNQNKTAIRCFAIILLLAVKMSFFAAGLSAQGTLGRIRNSVRKSDTSSSNRSSKPDSSRDNDHEDDNDEGHLASVIQSVRKNSKNQPTHSPPNHSHRGSRQSGRRQREHRHVHRRPARRNFCDGVYFSADPFYRTQIIERVHVIDAPNAGTTVQQPVQDFLIEDSNANVIVDSSVVDEFELREPEFGDWSLRMTAFYGGNFDHLTQGGFGLLINPADSIGLDIGVTTFRERGFSFRDHLWLGDANVVFGSGDGDLRTRIGLGVNWLADGYGSDAGFNLTAGFDLQIGPRWISSGELDFGSIGDTDLLHAQLSLGYRMKRSEWVAGYDYYDIGGTGIDGFFTGIRFRF